MCVKINLENQTLKAIQTTYIALKHQLEVETDPYIKSQIIDKMYLLLDEQKKILNKHKTAIDNYDKLEDNLE